MSSPDSLRAPLLWLLLPFAAGLVLADAFPPPPDLWRTLAWALLPVAGLTLLLARSPHRWAERGVGAALLGCGLWLGYVWLPLRSPPRIAWTHPPREVNVVLEIEQIFPPLPQRKTFSGLARVVDAEGPAAFIRGQRVYFAAIRRISTQPEISGHYRFRGVIEAVPEPGDGRGFEQYLAAQGVHVRIMRGHLREETQPPTAFRRFCRRAEARLEEILRHGLEDHPQLISLYLAMLLGEKAVLGTEQENAFMRTGVFHIFSISGLHVAAIALAIVSVLTLLRVPRRAGAIAGLATLWLYVQVTGGSTPAERAFLMIAFATATQMLRLPGNLLAALAAAAFTTLLLEPRQLFTTGFQMSYSVVVALIVMGIPLSDRWQQAWQPWRDLPEADWSRRQHGVRTLGRALLGGLAITCAALLASTPSSIGNFGLFSPGALLANLLVVPLASLAIAAGFVSLLAGLIGLMPVSLLFNHAAGVLITAMEAMVLQGAALPGMYFTASFHAGWMTGASLVILLGTMLLAADRRWRRPWGFWLPVAALGLVLILGVKFG